ncbi:hypothetical protein BDQ17DRAFT_1330373 [Cyathus striatus]|nr:hypothetical protein BDQ17DRAFT_1330373 [Cyathus striatus]
MGSSQTILVLLEHMHNVTYLHVASSALWVFEHLITMDMEVAYIWKSPNWTVVKALYIFVRYGTYIDECLNICGSIAIGVSASEVILTVRVWAVWQNSRNMAILLTVSFIGIMVPMYASDGILANSLMFELQEFLHIRGCLVTSAKIKTEEGILGLMLAYNTVKTGGRSTMTNVVIKDVNIIARIRIFLVILGWLTRS